MKEKALSLSELNALINQGIKSALPDSYWVIGETSDVRQNKNGHCYLELIDKQANSSTVLAKNRAYIWASTFYSLNAYFEQQTRQSFATGIKVLVRVSVDYHPVYGLGLNIIDIDPSYTLGDIQRQRQEILRQLENEGILTLNKELEFPVLSQRIAVITSPTAAGYGDFLNHLNGNKQGLVFYTRLFPAVMQGEQTESSVIGALERIFEHQTSFDVVVIIRGGGATSDLAAFDSYLLAAHCAQFPLPIVSGIGHERDNTILDEVAYHRAKTPTAAAAYLVDQMDSALQYLLTTQSSIVLGINRKIDFLSASLHKMAYLLPSHTATTLSREEYRLKSLANDIHKAEKSFVQARTGRLKEMEVFFSLSSPDYILSRGYSITYKDGKAIKSADQLKEGERIVTVLHKGTVRSRVE